MHLDLFVTLKWTVKSAAGPLPFPCAHTSLDQVNLANYDSYPRNLLSSTRRI